MTDGRRLLICVSSLRSLIQASSAWLGCIVWIAIVSTLWGTPVNAQSFSSYSTFESMTEGDAQTLQVQLTPLIDSGEELAPVTITATGTPADVSQFAAFRRPQFDYFDEGGGEIVEASPSELVALIANVGTLPNVTAGSVDPSPYLSFAMVNSMGPVGFEAVLDQSDATDLVAQIQLAFAANSTASITVAAAGCTLGLLPAGTPTDVTGDVSVVVSGFRLDSITGEFVGTATVTNDSAGEIPSPVSLVFLIPGNITLSGLSGVTCGTSPTGAQYVDLPGSLAPSEVVTLGVRLRNPDKQGIDVGIKVLAGPGTR